MNHNDIIKSRRELLERIGHVHRAAEIGVLRGQFSRKISEYLTPSEFYLIDTWGLHLPTFCDYKNLDLYAWMRMKASVKEWADPLGYKVVQSLSVEASRMFHNGFFDFVYIDADHERAYEDIMCWLPKVRKGGIIAGHDYVWNEGAKKDAVGLAVRQIFGTNFGHTREQLQSWFHIV